MSAAVTLADFLLARITEDRDGLECGIIKHDGASDAARTTSWTCGCDFRDKREVRAKWLIASEHQQWECDSDDYGGDPHCQVCGDVPQIPYPCATLRALALPYADHPDYQKEWAW